MLSMINDMSHQCKIVESVLSNCEWFFKDDSELIGEDGLPIIIPEDNMDFDSEMVAKKHAVITYSHGRLSIMDYGSKYGTLKTSIDQVEQGLYPPYKNFVIQNNDRIMITLQFSVNCNNSIIHLDFE